MVKPCMYILLHDNAPPDAQVGTPYYWASRPAKDQNGSKFDPKGCLLRDRVVGLFGLRPSCWSRRSRARLGPGSGRALLPVPRLGAGPCCAASPSRDLLRALLLVGRPYPLGPTPRPGGHWRMSANSRVPQGHKLEYLQGQGRLTPAS